MLNRFPAWVYERNRQRPPHTPFMDDWRGGAVDIQPGVWYPGVHPLAQTTSIEDLERFPWPDMDDPTRVAHVRRRPGSFTRTPILP